MPIARAVGGTFEAAAKRLEDCSPEEIKTAVQDAMQEMVNVAVWKFVDRAKGRIELPP